MRVISRIMLWFGLPVLLAGAVVALAPGTATAAENSGNEQKKTEQKADGKKNEDVYKYVAQSGDSYTLMARKATQDYSSKSKSNLSQAQIIYVETNLTQSAGSPYLEVGQKVEVKQADVKAWTEKAKKLSDAEKAAWNQFVASADFDTSGVGVAR